MRPEFIPVGHIVNAHGIKGEVKLNPEGFTPEFVAEFDTLYINGQAIRVKSRRVHKSTLLLTLPEGEYFDAELMGAAVLDDATGEELGTIRRVLHYPAHKVYEVRGQREYLIPAVPEVFIASVDADAGVVRIHMMKGLATDEN